MPRFAVCYSAICNEESLGADLGVHIKDARIDDIFCPKCKHAMIWMLLAPGDSFEEFQRRKRRGATKRVDNNNLKRIKLRKKKYDEDDE